MLHITSNYTLHTLCCSPHNVCNEEGKLNGMDLNRALYDDEGRVSDIIAGPFLVTGLTEDNFQSLTDDQMVMFEDKFHSPETFIRMGRSIMAILHRDPLPRERRAIYRCQQ